MEVGAARGFAPEKVVLVLLERLPADAAVTLDLLALDICTWA